VQAAAAAVHFLPFFAIHYSGGQKSEFESENPNEREWESMTSLLSDDILNRLAQMIGCMTKCSE
jgi:hypothetical protein